MRIKKQNFVLIIVKLNSITIDETYPMLKINNIEDHLLNAKYFTILEIASGIYHSLIAERDINIKRYL